jgi:hypothetical protein
LFNVDAAKRWGEAMKQPSSRLLTLLWLFAAGLALIAFAITYFKSGEIAWVPLMATIILAAIGILSARRGRER